MLSSEFKFNKIKPNDVVRIYFGAGVEIEVSTIEFRVAQIRDNRFYPAVPINLNVRKGTNDRFLWLEDATPARVVFEEKNSSPPNQMFWLPCSYGNASKGPDADPMEFASGITVGKPICIKPCYPTSLFREIKTTVEGIAHSISSSHLVEITVPTIATPVGVIKSLIGYPGSNCFNAIIEPHDQIDMITVEIQND